MTPMHLQRAGVRNFMSYPQLCMSTTALQTAVMGNTRDAMMGKHEGCCDGKTQGMLQSTGKVGRTENTRELVKPQQTNEGLSLRAEACVPLSSEMKTPAVPAR